MRTLRSIIKGLGALCVCVGVVLGGPLALSRWGRLDALLELDWSMLLTTPDDGSLVLGVVTVVGWIAWALATLSLLVEVMAAATAYRVHPRLPGTALFAPASAVLVTAILGLMTSQLAAPAPALADPDAEPPQPAPVARNQRLVESSEQAEAPPAHSGVTHLVAPGDDLWSLAERYLGEGSRWREIADANETVLLDPTDPLLPGMLLVIPHTDAATPGEVDGAGATADDGVAGDDGVRVVAGDTLTALATEHLGDPQRWPEILAANADLIEDPDVIEPGWVLHLGAREQPTDAVPAAVSEQPSTIRTEVPGDVPAQPPEVPVAEFASCPVPQNRETNATDARTGSSSGGQGTAASQNSWVASLSVTLGAALCAGLAGSFALRRRQQMAHRPLGRRLPPLGERTLPVSGALAKTLRAANVPARDRLLHTVCLGTDAAGDVTIDLARVGVLGVVGGDGDDVSLATALILTLVCGDGDAQVVAAGASFGWLASLDEPSLSLTPHVTEGADRLVELVAARSANLPAGAGLATLRSDPRLAPAWPQAVFVFDRPPASSWPSELAELGIAVVVCGQASAVDDSVHLVAGEARLTGSGRTFRPHLVEVPARRALDEMFTVANQTEYPMAAWWSDRDQAHLPTVLPSSAALCPVKEEPVAVHALPDNPMIMMLGPVELVGAQGQPPNRARKQCIEYCAWLLEHPDSTAETMATSLLVAEATRRSNMSRLRTWLGETPDGAAYLPDAYTGRIALHPAVSSDWETLQLCVGGGVNRVGDQSLIRALELVRGAPLADTAPGQWHWAEQLRADMVATIRDVGLVLAERAIAQGDLDLADWAVNRASTAAPDDEQLTATRIRVAHLAGDTDRVQQLVLTLTRNARVLGVDLSDEVVTLMQEVVEGRPRLRRA